MKSIDDILPRNCGGRVHYAKLVGKKVVPAETLREWSDSFESAKRVVAKTVISRVLKTEVSTVFLGLNHGHPIPFRGADLWFETMIFGGSLDGEQWRYETYEEAEAGHLVAVRAARAAACKSYLKFLLNFWRKK